jgi:hypothetical protein
VAARGAQQPANCLLFAVTAMLVFYALEDRSPWFILAFAGACVPASAFGFLQGASPFGVIEAIWGLVAIHHWRTRDSRRCRSASQMLATEAAPFDGVADGDGFFDRRALAGAELRVANGVALLARLDALHLCRHRHGATGGDPPRRKPGLASGSAPHFRADQRRAPSRSSGYFVFE